MASPILRYIVTMEATSADVVHFYGHGQMLQPAAAMRLPTEILHQIYTHLDPYGFNAARHACRSWFLAGMNPTVLVRMLKRGGWWSSIANILHSWELCASPLPNISQEWLMSKWLARECDLGPQQHSESQAAFVEISQTQFTDPGAAYSSADQREKAVIFTTSMCGRFLMVSHGGIIYVYELNHKCSPSTMSHGWSSPS
ncbi:hypothetical protein CCHL11_07545 [Colletotrichum chlorophyti]|uniref:F-box domain-containing protein n=1 Tax=Colletotrichum chlorophyti TaxID=708187 RepID=A0A1Q8RZQ7_9PEZI|nr:hypothetical protein CCHL11_07545 [Colletotrichum chlorophyti]